MWIVSAEAVHADMYAKGKSFIEITKHHQEESDMYHEMVREMHETLIRIDENVKHLKNK